MNTMPLSQIIPTASDSALELIGDMLQYDPQKRPTASGMYNLIKFV